MNASPHTVAFVDDHPAMLDALTMAFERANWQVLCAEPTIRMAAQRFIVAVPDLLITDLHVGREDGVELIKLFLTQYPTRKVLVYSQLADAITVVEAVRAGAMGYVLKEYGVEVVVEAAQKVVTGAKFYSSELVEILLQIVGNGQEKKPLLTDQEMKVLNMIVEGGQSLKQIAAKLNIHFSTAAKHRQSIMEKLNARDEVEILHRAFALGLIDLRRPSNR
ncbi:response regulator [Runella aurantiaca]|uniref:DNA-binding response regulator n=1 Tax=Runella aurantiaca TaxID=2282308 RepID=A0A369IGN6_9BACT|nr:response regulator transcription factor [Runella aurantiaca]RDB07517.1 DNA-binding response regulator [Runella aurantiaca]